MKFSFQWLATLVDLKDFNAQDVALALNRAGIEVEEVKPLVNATHITTGFVKARTMIEGSDHLSKVIVDTGKHGERTIVCGAPNIRPGQKVLVALPGAVLPKLTIQASVIKGVPSEGMVCALNELGIDAKFLRPDQVEGIEVLPENTPVGRDEILTDLGLNDTIISLKLLANRPDLWAIEGIAKEVAALLQRPLIPTQVASEPALPTFAFKLDVQSEKTSQFSIRVMQGIQATATPAWMKQRLIASGVRPISFLVDVGNYVMLLTGQPLHMYDLKKLPVHGLTLSDHWDKPFVALDQKTYALQSGDIVITSQDHVMCLAGVMGADHCAVDAQTTDIAIEAAAFDPASIRKTALRLNLISDASMRFAKGIDLSQFDRVLTLTTHLIQQLTKVEKVYQTVTVNRFKEKTLTIPWEPQAINQLLSTQFPETLMVETLARFGIVSKPRQGGYLATIPVHRQDLQGVADLAEEIIRVQGFDAITLTPMPLHIQAGGLNEKQEKVRAIKTYLGSQGIDEVLGYTLIEPQWLQQFNFLSTKEPWVLKNPLSEERKHVRTDVMGSLIQIVQYNLARQVESGQIFEIANISHRQGQQLQLGMAMFGQRSLRSAMLPTSYSFFDIKAHVEGLLTLLQIEPSRYQWVVNPNLSPMLHPGRSAQLVVQNQVVGVLGQLMPNIQTTYDLGKHPVMVAHLDLQALLDFKTSPLKLKPIPRFPSVTRDLAFYLPTTIPFAQIVKTVKKAGKKLVEQVLLFDLYQGASLPQGQLSMAIRLVLRDEQKTLQEEEITQALSAIQSALVSDCQVTLRS